MTKVVVIGGGISGLVAAYRLRKLDPTVEIVVVERDRRLGGKILTEQRQGFVIEGGADRIPAHDNIVAPLCVELGLGHALQRRDPRQAQVMVKHHGALYPLPLTLGELQPTDLATLTEHPLISLTGKQRLRRDATAPAQLQSIKPDETVAAFVNRTLGREIYDKLVEPLVSSIYANSGDQLSAAALFAQWRRLEQSYGSLLNSLQAEPTAVSHQPAAASSALVGGMATLVQALSQQLPEDAVITGERVTYLRRNRTRRGYMIALDSGDVLTADALIITTPAYITARLVDSLDATLASLHGTIPYASVASVALAYTQLDASALSNALEGYGYVLPHWTNSDVRACAYSSNLWPNRAPAGAFLLQVALGRYGQRDVTECSDAELLALARQEVGETLGLTASPTFSRIYRWPLALPQYTLGHGARVAQIEERQRHHPGLFLAGAAYRGLDIADCVRDGERAAHAVMYYLHANQSLTA